MGILEAIKNIFMRKPSQKEAVPIRKDEIYYNKSSRVSFFEEREKRREEEEKKRIEEKKDRARIFELYQNSSTFRDYLIETKKFNEIYGKNVRCDVCGWDCGLDSELYSYNGQTYCSQHIPASRQIEHERVVTAGKHGAIIDFIKK